MLSSPMDPCPPQLKLLGTSGVTNQPNNQQHANNNSSSSFSLNPPPLASLSSFFPLANNLHGLSSLPGLSFMPPMLNNFPSIDSLVRAAERDRLSPVEYFLAMVDLRPISPIEWEETANLKNLSALTQKPVAFPPLVASDVSTHATLVITQQPGPVFVANAYAPLGTFRIRLQPHPLLPPQTLQSWHVGNLQVSLFDEPEDENSSLKPGSKKRLRSKTASKSMGRNKKSYSLSAHQHKEYSFDKLEVLINDLVFPASGCRPMRLLFSCSATDPLKRTQTFSAVSNPFMVISNCNQWKDGLGVCLKHYAFPNGAVQAPFNRFFNYLQLLYLDSKGFDEARYLDPKEIHDWLQDAASEDPILDRDSILLDSQKVVTQDLFDTWFDSAGPVFYDLHTSNVGKLFQKLWAAGFIGIGAHRNVSVADWAPGHCRLNINTLPGAGEQPAQSYLVLRSPGRSYPLLALERDHLSYFFEHSRNSIGCTHLMSAVTPNQTLPVVELFANSPKLNILSSPDASSSSSNRMQPSSSTQK